MAQFQGGMIDERPIIPMTFDTGQILIGLAAGVREFGDVYRDCMRRAGDWLVHSQDPDGCWRRHAATPFALAGEKTYEAHVAWGLLDAQRLEPGRRYAEAALANVRWAIGRQQGNGWFEDCCLTDHTRPLSHTIGYTLRGIIEAYRFSGDMSLYLAARRAAEGLLTALAEDGWLAGRFYSDWSPAVRWSCLTGTAQIACCWLLLYQQTGDPRYRDAALAANRYVRRTMDVNGPPETRGAIKGSFPIHGDYGSYEYLNWAVKFCVDANLLERAIGKDGASTLPAAVANKMTARAQ